MHNVVDKALRTTYGNYKHTLIARKTLITREYSSVNLCFLALCQLTNMLAPPVCYGCVVTTVIQFVVSVAVSH